MRLNSYYLKWMSIYKNDADSRKELLRRCKGWLESYLDYLDTDIPLLGEPNNSLDNLIKELEKEIGDD